MDVSKDKGISDQNIPDQNIIHTAGTDTPVAAWVGIDVAKLSLAVCLLLESGQLFHGTFSNDRKGFRQLLAWVKRVAKDRRCHFCMEATGSYSTALAQFLAHSSMLVSVVNPYLIKSEAISQNSRNKTDKADAQVIAVYCRDKKPRLWVLAEPQMRVLVGLVRHLHTLKEQRTQCDNRLQEPEQVPAVTRSLETLQASIQKEIDQIQKQINQHIHQDPDLKGKLDLLVSIPGIGQETAQVLLAELPDLSQLPRAASVGAFAGLQPRLYQSGTSVHKRSCLSKRGNRHLRAALYWPAITALRYNPQIMAFAQRLADKGKSKMCIIGAAMRKLLIIAVGVLKSQKAFSPTATMA